MKNNLNSPKMKLNRVLLAVSAVITLSTSNYVHAGGIPVIDVAAIAQAIQQVQAWGKQFQQMQDLKDMSTGSRGMGNIMNDPNLQSILPTDWNNVLASIKSSPKYANERAKYPTVTGQPKLNAQYDLIASQVTGLNDLFTKVLGRQSQVQSLMTQIDAANDPAAKADLQNRLLNEQNAIATTSQMISLINKKNEQESEAASNAVYQEYLCHEYNKPGC